MKRIQLCLLYLLVITVLLGCSCIYEFSESRENIEAIELVNVEAFPNQFGEKPEVISIIKQIPNTKHDSFLEQFINVPCFRYAGDRIEHIGGEAIRVVYTDGSFELIDVDTTYYEACDGSWNISSYHFDEDAFERFIESYH